MPKDNPFKKAVKEQEKMRLGVFGPSGSGKTWTSLEVATRIARKEGGRVAFIDTEGRSARKYASYFDFDVVDLSGDYNPTRYIRAIDAAEQFGYAVLIIDSFSHAWNGAGGVLEVVDAAGKKMGGNDWAGWSKGRPLQNSLVNRILTANIHIIGCMRAKTEWVLEERKGKSVPIKVGTTSVQSTEFEYEFDVTLLMNMDHSMTVSKSRCQELIINETYDDLDFVSDSLYAWANDGIEPPQPLDPETTPFNQLPEQQGRKLLLDKFNELNIGNYDKLLKGLGLEKFSDYAEPLPMLIKEIERVRSTSSNNQPANNEFQPPAPDSNKIADILKTDEGKAELATFFNQLGVPSSKDAYVPYLSRLGVKSFSDSKLNKRDFYAALREAHKQITTSTLKNVPEFKAAVRKATDESLSDSEIMRLLGNSFDKITDFDAAKAQVIKMFEAEMTKGGPAKPKAQSDEPSAGDDETASSGANTLTVTRIERRSKSLSILTVAEMPDSEFRLYSRQAIRDLGGTWERWVDLIDIGDKRDFPTPILITEFEDKPNNDYYLVKTLATSVENQPAPAPGTQSSYTQPSPDQINIPF